MQRQELDWRKVIRWGLLAGLAMLYLAVIGMVESFSQRAIIAAGNATLASLFLPTPAFFLGRFLLFVPPILAGVYSVRRPAAPRPLTATLGLGLVAGGLSSLPLSLIILVEAWLNRADLSLRAMFVNISPILAELVLYGQSLAVGVVLALAVSAVLGGMSAGITQLPDRWRRTINTALAVTLFAGLFGELFTQILRPVLQGALRTFFRSGALTFLMALITFVLAGLAGWYGRDLRTRHQSWLATQPPARRQDLAYGQTLLSILLLLALPWILNTFLSEVMNNVGLYIIMGLGLNIAVGLAGLLDLGYVTNYAVGAYIMGVLTAQPPDGSGVGWPFWLALPVCILAAMLTGFLFALPVLRMRGDYLAIATLGFGEIIRVLAISDWLRPWIGGAQGILYIPKPELFDGLNFSDPRILYYVILAGCVAVLYVAWRLNNSRTGRKWMAIREDEAVAEAMGINLVRTKVLAFTLSAAAGGLAGGIFAAKLGNVFPQSFTVFVSINVLSVIIVGGMGSIPGVIVGAIALVGLPGILTEFAEYRQLLYGAVLVWMMLQRPEGLVPSAVRLRERRAEAAANAPPTASATAP